MVRDNVRSRFVWFLVISLYSISCKGAERNAANDKDTTILARSVQSFTISNDRPFYQAEFISTGKKLSGNMKTVLLMDAVSIAKDPDGVYEVYITAEKSGLNLLSSSHPGFINVLDTYVLTAASSSNDLSIDLSKRVSDWAKDGQSFSSLVVTILFRGNKLPTGAESTQAGQLAVKGMRIVQQK